MNKSNFTFKNAAFVMTVLLLVCVANGGGCKVGLGETVDTEPPKIHIEEPKIKAVVSSDVEVSGTWEDDKGISRVEISVTNNDTNTEIIPGENGSPVQAQIDGKKWKYTLLTSASENAEARAAQTATQVLMDGTYKLCVVAYVNVGHESATMERIF